LLPDVIPARDHHRTGVEQCRNALMRQSEALCRILTVDDNEIGRNALRDTLEVREHRPGPRLSNDITEEQDSNRFAHVSHYRAYSTIRVSRIIVTLIRPG
jgi:hypothetical protein